MANRFLHRDRITGGAELIAPHEFCIGEGVPAVPPMSLHHRRIQWPVQRARYLLCDIALQLKQPICVELAFPRPSGLLRVRVKQCERKLPLSLRHLHRTMDNKPNSHTVRNFGRWDFGGQAQDGSYREHINIEEVPEKRDQRVSKSQAYSQVIGSLSDQNQWQYQERCALAPMALALHGNPVSRKLTTIATILSINDAYRTDEPVALAHNRFNKVGLSRVVT